VPAQSHPSPGPEGPAGPDEGQRKSAEKHQS
jgi:hypothetical protein